MSQGIRSGLAIAGRAPRIPLVITLLFVIVAVFGPFIAPYSPIEGALADELRPPFLLGGGVDHLLGTDRLGRDILSRLILGARVSLIVSFTAIAVSAAIGTTVGIVSGYFGGVIDAVLMRLVDVTLSLPLVLLALVLGILVGPSLLNIVIIVAALLWARYARLVRGDVLSVRGKDYVSYARIVGSSDVRTMVLHIFPNVVNSLLVMITLQVGYVIVLEASLSFLGVGIPPPTPAWGLMVADGRQIVRSAWWVSFFPGVTITLVVLSMNMLGDWIRDLLDPRLRQL